MTVAALAPGLRMGRNDETLPPPAWLPVAMSAKEKVVLVCVDADHVAAAVGAQSVKVHGTLSHDAATCGRGCAIDADGGGIGDAMAAGRGAQIAIDPLGDAFGGGNIHGDGFGAAAAAIRLGEVGDADLAVVGGGVAQGEEFVEACSCAAFGKVPHFTHRACDRRHCRCR